MRSQVIDDLVTSYSPKATLTMGPKGFMRRSSPVGNRRSCYRMGLEGVIDLRERRRSIRSVYGETAAFGPEIITQHRKQILLQTIDAKWREHLLTANTFGPSWAFVGMRSVIRSMNIKLNRFSCFDLMGCGLM
jgi:preprotein translocase subunit SecA